MTMESDLKPPISKTATDVRWWFLKLSADEKQVVGTAVTFTGDDRQTWLYGSVAGLYVHGEGRLLPEPGFKAVLAGLEGWNERDMFLGPGGQWEGNQAMDYISGTQEGENVCFSYFYPIAGNLRKKIKIELSPYQ